MEELYKKNLELFKEQRPGFIELIENSNLDNYSVDIQGENIDIKYENESLYPISANISAKMQVENYKKNPKSYSMLPVRTDGKIGDVHDEFIKKLEDASPLMDKDGNYAHSRGVHIHNNQIPLMLISGCGIGFHIQYLLEEYEIFNLIIYDENSNFLKLSMHFIDWEPILEYFKRKGRSISFFCHEEPKTLANMILYAIKEFNASLGTVIYHFKHFSNEHLTETMKEVLAEGYLLVLGWGFYDDEIVSLKNTLANIDSNHPIFSRDGISKKMCDIPIFIVGSGPSLDKDIEFIKKNKDKAIICSAGSTLSVLNNHGIKPTFHFEIEREPSEKYTHGGTYEKLVDSNLSSEYLEEINFIGLNVLDPEVFTLFKNTYMYFRTNDCGSSTTSGTITKINITNPSVTNAICSFAVLLRFKNVYLFGLDNGYLDPKKHHSKDSAYYKHQPKHMEDIEVNSWREAPGNFGGTFKTDMKLSWIKEKIENSFRLKDKQATIYNCSDGVKIEHTEPLRSSDIKLTKKYSISMKEEVFLSHFIKYNKKDVISTNSHTDAIKEVLEDIKIIREVCKKYMGTITVKELYIINQYLHDFIKVITKQTTRSLIGGTAKVLHAYAYMHIMASDKKEENDFYAKLYLKVLDEFLEFVEKDLKRIFL